VQKKSERIVTSFHKQDLTEAIKIGGKWFQKESSPKNVQEKELFLRNFKIMQMLS
jgi:hypothetical protein